MTILENLRLNQKLLLLIVVPLLVASYFATNQMPSAISLRSSIDSLAELGTPGQRPCS